VTAMLTRPKRDLLESFDIDTTLDSRYVSFLVFLLNQCLLFSRTTYESAFTWLSRINNDGDTEGIAVDLQSHFNIGQRAFYFYCSSSL
jgi:hypothetical protein